MVPKLTKKEKDALLKEARDRRADVLERDAENRKWQREDTKFVYEPGGQWANAFKDRRKGEQGAADDPCLEFNQLKQFVNQVVNDQRQSRPGIRVHPADSQATDDTAETIQGLARAIEYDSQAEAVYDGGYQGSVVGGRGFWRIVSEYEDAKSFNQKLVIKRVPDPLSVVPDIDFQAPDASDMNFCFVDEALTKDEFERKWPKARIASWNAGDEFDEWFDDKKIIVSDYYRRICVKRDVVMLPDGTSVWADELPEGMSAEGLPVRESEDYRIEWYKLGGGQDVLEVYDWPGSIIPVVMDMGDEIVVDGKRMFQGLIRMARDAQSLFNFAMTAQAIHLASAPRAPYIMAEGQAEGYEALWRDANKKNFAYLYYKPQMVDGALAPPPQRNPPSMPDAGLMNASQQATQLIRSTIGMYENSLGLHGQETSGRAIVAREKQGDNATFHYADNHARAIALTGRIIVELIPHYYDTQRTAYIVGQDDERQEAELNVPDPLTGEVVKNNLTSGKYTVTVSSGPTYATKRQESADMLMQLVQAVPDVMKVAGDLVIKAQDLPDAEVLSERFKMLLPPQIQQAEQARAAKQNPQIAMLTQTVQQLQGQLQQVQQQAQQAVGQLQQENAQLKADKSAQREANQAKADAAQQGAAVDMEKIAVDRDKVFVDLIKALTPFIAPPQVAPVATGMLEQNP